MIRSLFTTAVILTAISAIACGGSRGDSTGSNSTAVGSTSTSDSTPNGRATACDDYVRIVTQCIETKMPEPDRTEEGQQLATFKKMLAQYSTAPETAAAQCTANLRTAFRQDSYGCYTDEAAKRGIQTACSLLTRAELERIVGASLEDGVPDNMRCRYAFAGQPLRQPLLVGVHWNGGRDEVEAARGGQAIVNGRLGRESGQADPVPGAALTGVGDEAFFVVAGIQPMLSARLGDVSIEIHGADRDQSAAIARLALPRITPDPPEP
jgi:hypothetical protein